MLRHYDEIGLLKPKSIGEENGYRYYEYSQYKQILRIEHLKEYDFTLHEIKELLTLSEEELKCRLNIQYEHLKKQKEHYESLVLKMETELNHKQDSNMSDYHVITMTMKEQKVLGVKRTIKVDGENMHALIQALREKMAKEQVTQTGPIQVCYLDEEFNEENATVEMQVEVHNEYHIAGPSLERLIKDEHMAKTEEELETAVMFPITLKRGAKKVDILFLIRYTKKMKKFGNTYR